MHQSINIPIFCKIQTLKKTALNDDEPENYFGPRHHILKKEHDTPKNKQSQKGYKNLDIDYSIFSMDQ